MATEAGARAARVAAVARRAWLAALVLLCVAWLPAQAAPRIGVATMQPGEIFFERFGHNAIVVDDPAAGGALSYNFGFFDPSEPGFHARFVRGEMRYRLAVLPFEDDLAYYASVGRGVSVQWLDLEPAEAGTLAARLAENALPGNAAYDYDYFRDNCSTRVRDALDEAVGGLLGAHMHGRSRGTTYRSEAVPVARPDPLMALGFVIGLGPAADRPNSLWADAFVPMRLAATLRDIRRPDGRPLVAAEEDLLPHRIAPEPEPRRVAWWPWLLAGLALAALAWSGRRRPRAVAAAAVVAWGVSAVAAGLMVFIWLGTEHVFGWANHNLPLLNPLCLLLLPGAVRIARGGGAGPAFRGLLALFAACLVLAPFLQWLPAWPQRNAHWIALLVPLNAALAAVLWRAEARPKS